MRIVESGTVRPNLIVLKVRYVISIVVFSTSKSSVNSEKSKTEENNFTRSGLIILNSYFYSMNSS